MIMQDSRDNVEDSLMKRIMVLHKCKTGEHPGRQCYEVQVNDGEPGRIGEHLDISNEMQFHWAEDCVSVTFTLAAVAYLPFAATRTFWNQRGAPKIH
jgi:hypothetical protein